MNKVAVIEGKFTNELSDIGIPSTIQGNLLASLQERRKKLHEMTDTSFKKEVIAYVKSIEKDDLELWSVILFFMAVVACIVGGLVSIGPDGNVYYFMKVAGYCFGILVLFVNFLVSVYILSKAKEKSKRMWSANSKIPAKYDRLENMLCADPVTFLKQAISYCQAKDRLFIKEISQIQADFEVAVMIPKREYDTLGLECLADLDRLERASEEDVPNKIEAIAARQSKLELCDSQLREIHPEEVRLSNDIARVKAKSGKIRSNIAALIRLKTEHESYDQILARAKADMTPEAYDSMIETRRQKALQNIQSRLDTLESDIDYTTKGIADIVQAIPEPERFQLRPALKLVA